MDSTNYNNIKAYCGYLANSIGDKQLWTKDTTKKFKPLDHEHYVDAICNSLNLYYEFTKGEDTEVAIPHYVNADTGLTTPLLPELMSLILQINKDLRIKTNSLEKLVNEIILHIIHIRNPQKVDTGNRLYTQPHPPEYYIIDNNMNTSVRVIRPAPSHWIRFTNGIFDLKTKQLLKAEDIKDAGNYNYLKGFLFDYVPAENRNPLHLQLLERLTLEWGDNKEDNQEFIKQIVFAVIEGRNKGVCIILKSDGGGGKSTFISMLQEVVALATNNAFGAVVQCGLFELHDDHKIKNLSPATMLIVGDEAPTDAKLSDEALARVKNIADDNSAKSVGFMINVKFGPARTVKSNALILQNTNSSVSLFESTAAVKDRVLLFPWTNKNFRDDKNKDLSINVTINNTNQDMKQEFYQNFISWIIDTTKYFDTFLRPKSLTIETDKMLAPTGAIPTFIEYLETNGLLTSKYVLLSVLYQIFKPWCKIYFTASSNMTLTTFITEMVKHLTPLGFELKDSKVYVSKLEFMNAQIVATNKILGYAPSDKDYIELPVSDTVMINPDNKISPKDIKHFSNEPPNKNIMRSLRDLIMYYTAIHGDKNISPNPLLVTEYVDIIN